MTKKTITKRLPKDLRPVKNQQQRSDSNVQRRRCSIKKIVLKNFAIFTRKHLCWSPFLIQRDFITKKLQHRCFHVSIAKFLRTPILKNICEWLLLHS